MKSHKPENGHSDRVTVQTRSRELFQQAVDQLDVATSNRLRLMRREALASSGRVRGRWMLAATGASAAAVLLVGLSVWPIGSRDSNQAVKPTVADVDAVTFPADDDAEMYAWLDDAPVAVDSPGGAL